MKVIVIGSAGYVGKRVMAALRARGAEPVGVDVVRVPDLADETCDITAPEEVFALLDRTKPDAVINLVYLLMEASAANPQRALRVNILGMNTIFEAVNVLGVPRVVFASSGAVYGDYSDHGDAVITEQTQSTPRTLYGHMKSFNEAMAEHYNNIGRTQIISLRLASLHGRDKTGTFAPMDIIVRGALAGEDVVLPWSRKHEFSFIHVDDAAAELVELALAKRPAHTVYNSGGEQLSMAELIETAEPICNIKIETEEPGRTLLHPSLVSGDRFAEEFGFERGSMKSWLERELEERSAARVPVAT
jgi:UDP-glucose 4-epimerase